MSIQEITDAHLVQRCAKCDIETRLELADLDITRHVTGAIGTALIGLPPCVKCHSVEFLLPTPDGEPDHPAPGSFGHLHRLLVDHLFAELTKRRGAPDDGVAHASHRRLDEDAIRQWFPHGLKLEVPA